VEFPHAYDKGRKLRDAQDSFCAVAGEWATLEVEGAEFLKSCNGNAWWMFCEGASRWVRSFARSVTFISLIFSPRSSRFIATK